MTVYPALATTIKVEVSHQAHADLRRLVATGLFGFTVADCAARFIDAGLQQKSVEGWLPMPVFVEPTSKVAPRKRKPDLVRELITERTKKNPRFPALVAAAAKKRRRR